MPGTLAQNLVFGILVGALYGLAAVGLSLVFGVTKFLNVSQIDCRSERLFYLITGPINAITFINNKMGQISHHSDDRDR